MTSATEDANMLDAIRRVVDNTTAGRVFGTPISQDGVVILPVAKIEGGAGVGSAPAGTGSGPQGSGGGFGVTAKPVGVFVLRDGRMSWHPAVDVNRIVLGGQLVAVAALLVLRALVKGRRHRRRHGSR